jgi:hypothetical protein
VTDFTLRHLCVRLRALTDLRLSGCAGVTDAGLFGLSAECAALTVPNAQRARAARWAADCAM